MASKLIYAKDVCLFCIRGYEYKPNLYYCIYCDPFYTLANPYLSCFWKSTVQASLWYATLDKGEGKKKKEVKTEWRHFTCISMGLVFGVVRPSVCTRLFRFSGFTWHIPTVKLKNKALNPYLMDVYRRKTNSAILIRMYICWKKGRITKPKRDMWRSCFEDNSWMKYLISSLRVIWVQIKNKI